jgi:hypothetical protein
MARPRKVTHRSPFLCIRPPGMNTRTASGRCGRQQFCERHKKESANRFEPAPGRIGRMILKRQPTIKTLLALLGLFSGLFANISASSLRPGEDPYGYSVLGMVIVEWLLLLALALSIRSSVLAAGVACAIGSLMRGVVWYWRPSIVSFYEVFGSPIPNNAYWAFFWSLLVPCYGWFGPLNDIDGHIPQAASLFAYVTAGYVLSRTCRPRMCFRRLHD